MSDSPMMTLQEAARWCRVSVGAFDAHVRSHLPSKKIGRRVVFHRADLEAWAQSEATAAAAKAKPAVKRPQRPQHGSLVAQLLADPRAKASCEWLTSRKVTTDG